MEGAVSERQRTSGNLRESSRRVAILVVVIGSHLGLLALILRPTIFHRHAAPVVDGHLQALKLRFFRLPQPSPPPLARPAQRHAAPSDRAAPSAKPPRLPTSKHAAHIDEQTHQRLSAFPPPTDTGGKNASSDGGFQQRLRDAQEAHSVRRIPGSDTPFAPGIHFIDPKNQGIGAVMRKLQRAFGIENRHCIDADVWRHLTPQELIARHVSSDDVEKVEKEYECNQPPGLHF